MKQTIYKIFTAQQWQLALVEGVFKGAPVDLVDGFIHLSAHDQVEETASKHFRGQSGLKLVAFEVQSLGDALKWETSRGGALFPHLYASIDPALAMAVHDLSLDDSGIPVFPEAY